MSKKNNCGCRRIDAADSGNRPSLGDSFGPHADPVHPQQAANQSHAERRMFPASILTPTSARSDCRPCLVLVELDETLAMGQTSGTDDDTTSASASIVHYDRSTNDYGVTSELAQITVHHVLTDHDGSNRPLGVAPLGSGDRSWAYYNPQSGRWEILHQPNTTTRFELTSNLFPGSNATAERVVWNRSTLEYETDGASFTVYDSLCHYTNVTGCRGLAEYWADSDRWEIIRLDDLSTSCSSGS